MAGSYSEFVQPEYSAIRHAAALIDVSPLYKYRLRGPDAGRVLDHVVTHAVSGMHPDQAIYTPWCDADGKVRQEGTIFRLGQEEFQLNAAEPAYAWLQANAAGYRVQITDCTDEIAALSLQGPHSREILRQASDADMDGLRFFRHTRAVLGGTHVLISRTGYTGDLGYEIWLDASAAVPVWDALMAAGEPYRITPCGLLAMDIARLETGFILINVDYASSESARIESEKVSPYELGLGWAVKLDKGRFIGHEALAAEKAGKAPGTRWRLVGLEIDWEPLERLYQRVGLMPDLPQLACRETVPVYRHADGPQIGRATTRVWSTLLKKYIALATIEARYAEPGTEVAMEVTVHHRRQRAPARIVRPPFYRPERMKS